MIITDEHVLQRELEYHEQLYSGFAQHHFSRPAVRSFRAHSAARIMSVTHPGPQTRLLSLGCGIADTELLIAPHVKELVGIDLSRAAIRQAQTDARRLGLSNIHFRQGTLWDIKDKFDVVIGIFFLHHLSDTALDALPEEIYRRLRPGGVFYSLDPSVSRLSGKIGRILIPSLMRRYNTEDERELSPQSAAARFRTASFAVRCDMYDFGSTPLAGLFPGWRFGYNLARKVDDIILKFPPLRRWGSNFEIIARRNETS